jgi:hypothetical protein
MIKDITFTFMRTQGTKYNTIDTLPGNALPVSKFAHQYAEVFNVSSPAYVHVKYDRHKFGYPNKAGHIMYTSHPGYDIVDFQGTCYVINYNQNKS